MGEARGIPVEALLAETDWLRRVAEALVRDPGVADDIAQQTLLAALQRPPSSDRPLRPWLRVVVENFARMHRRAAGARERREAAVARPESAPSNQALYERVELQRELAAEVLALDEPLRAVVVLHYYEGLTSVEIARRLGAPDGTVRWRLKRGLEELRDRLDRKHGGDRGAWLSGLVAWVGVPMPVRRPKSEVPAASLGLAATALLAIGWAVWSFALRPSVEPGEQAAQVEVESSQEDSVARSSGERRAPTSAPTGTVPTRSSRVLVRVLDRAGMPARGARLSAREEQAPADESGEAILTLEVAEPRRITVDVRAEGFVTESREVVLAPGRDVHLGELELERAAALEGRLLPAPGVPLRAAWVRVEVLGSRLPGLAAAPLEELRALGSMLGEDVPSVTPGADGRYRFDGLREGFVRLWYGADGCETHCSDELDVRAGEARVTQAFQLVALGASCCIEGRVFDAAGVPLADALVEAGRISLREPFFRGSAKVHRARSDENGRFSLSVGVESRYDVAAARPDGTERPVSSGPHVGGDFGVVLQLERWNALEVEVLDESGAALDAEIELWDPRRDEPLVAETASWRAGVHRAPWCEYELEISAPGHVTRREGPFSPDESRRLVVSLDRAPRVTGRVIVDGQPVERALVQWLPAADEARGSLSLRSPGFDPFHARVAIAGWGREVPTRADGSFELTVRAASPYFVRARHPGRATAMLGPFAAQDRGDLQLDIVLSVGGSIAGRVLHAEGASVAGTIVGASCGDGHLVTCRVGPDGLFRFEGLAPGPWQVRRVEREALGSEPLELAPGGGAPPKWDVQVVEGEESRLDLVLDPARRTRIVGRFCFDGRGVGPWAAEARLTAQRTSCVLSPDGEFALELAREGEWTLSMAWLRPDGCEYSYRESLERWNGTRSIVRDWPSARLDVDCGSEHAGQVVALLRAEPDGGELQVHARVDGDGLAQLEPVPAGVVQVRVGDSAPVSIELIAGERRALSWPRGR